MEIIDKRFENKTDWNYGDVVCFWDDIDRKKYYGLISKAYCNQYAITVLNTNSYGYAGNIVSDHGATANAGDEDDWCNSIEALKKEMTRYWDHVEKVGATLMIKNLGDDDE